MISQKYYRDTDYVENAGTFSGVQFKLGGPVDAHHNQARFQWHAGPADAPEQYVGFDLIVTDDGRIRNVYGFMDAASAA